MCGFRKNAKGSRADADNHFEGSDQQRYKDRVQRYAAFLAAHLLGADYLPGHT